MRIIFMGSSEASATCLHAIMRLHDLQVVGVITQPDRPVGRGKKSAKKPVEGNNTVNVKGNNEPKVDTVHGRKLVACPCKQKALSCVNEKDILTPENINSPEALAWMRERRPDVIAVVAYGQFLRAEVLNLPKLGCYNCHFSLLPKYRGASPVTETLLAGDELAGISVIKMGIGMDDGPILRQKVEPVMQEDTSATLMDRLAICGGVALAKVLSRLGAGEKIPEIPQEEALATFAHKHKKEDGIIHWFTKTQQIELVLRAFTPWPGCYTYAPARLRPRGTKGRMAVLGLEFVKNELIQKKWYEATPGMVVAVLERRGVVVRTGDGVIMITAIQFEGGKAMTVGEYLKARSFEPFVDVFTEEVKD